MTAPPDHPINAPEAFRSSRCSPRQRFVSELPHRGGPGTPRIDIVLPGLTPCRNIRRRN